MNKLAPGHVPVDDNKVRIRGGLVRLDVVIGLVGRPGSSRDSARCRGDGALEATRSGGEGDAGRGSASQHASRALRSE